MKEPKEFLCFDDFDNDGWGNSTIEPIGCWGDEDEDIEEDDLEPEEA